MKKISILLIALIIGKFSYSQMTQCDIFEIVNHTGFDVSLTKLNLCSTGASGITTTVAPFGGITLGLPDTPDDFIFTVDPSGMNLQSGLFGDGCAICPFASSSGKPLSSFAGSHLLTVVSTSTGFRVDIW